MQDIKVDPYGIKIMLPKALSYLVRINSLSCIEANILKQEMLSLGAEVAVSRDTLTGKAKKTDCLLMGNLSQYSRLIEKLDKQPFGLRKIAPELSRIVTNYEKDNFTMRLGRYKLDVRPGRTYIMGIVNVTPDSFSADGLYDRDTEYIVAYAEKMISDGADMIDIGGESTRPGAKAISLKEELARTIPVIKKLSKRIKVPVSVDTYKPEVASIALDNGASIINDISGFKNSRMLKVASRHKCGVIIMHSKGTPKYIHKDAQYGSLLDEIITGLYKAIERLIQAGINKDRLIVDPGIGFSKAFEHNLQILKNLNELKILGAPILVGTSRKSFIGKILGLPEQERLSGTISSSVLAVKNGANFLRVHDVKEVKQAVKVMDAINNA